MTLTKKELAAAHQLESAAAELNEALNTFASSMQKAMGTISDAPAAYALGLAVLKETGMKAAVETLEAGVKAKLHDLESDAESPNILLARMNIPAYSFVQKEKSKANILDKSPKSFLHILKVIVESGKADAIEKRLKADAFTPKMLEACEGLVNVTTEETWSVTKKKV